MGNYFKQAVANIGELGNGKAVAQLFLQPTIGAAIYTAVPSALQGWFNVDMTGWKMPIIGTLSSVATGVIAGKPGIVAGGFGAFLAHLAYTKFQSGYKAIFKTYIPRFDPNLVATFADGENNGQQQQLPPAQAQVSLDGGDRVSVYNAPQRTYEATAVPNQTRAAVRVIPAPRITAAAATPAPALAPAPAPVLAAPVMSDNGNATGLYDNGYTTSLNDNNAPSLSDEFTQYNSLMDSNANQTSLNPAFIGDAGGRYY